MEKCIFVALKYIEKCKKQKRRAENALQKNTISH